MRMKYVVRRGSQTHQTPHSKRVHTSPEIIVAMMNTSVTCIAVRDARSCARSFVARKRAAKKAATAIAANDATATGTCR